MARAVLGVVVSTLMLKVYKKPGKLLERWGERTGLSGHEGPPGPPIPDLISWWFLKILQKSGVAQEFRARLLQIGRCEPENNTFY